MLPRKVPKDNEDFRKGMIMALMLEKLSGRGYCCVSWGLQDCTLQGGAGSRLQRVQERAGGKEAEEAGVLKQAPRQP